MTKTTPPQPTPTPQAPDTLESALLRAQRSIETVQKASKNTHHGYKYASAEDVLAAAREALHGAGLTAQTMSSTLEPVEHITIGKTGAQLYFGDIICEFALVLAATGETKRYTFRLPVVCDGGRPPDKAMLGSLTEARAYWLGHVLAIVRTEEGVSDRGDADGPARRTSHGGKASRDQAPPVREAATPEEVAVGKAARFLEAAAKTHPDVVQACHRDAYGTRAPASLSGSEVRELANLVQDQLPAHDAAKAPARHEDGAAAPGGHR